MLKIINKIFKKCFRKIFVYTIDEYIGRDIESNFRRFYSRGWRLRVLGELKTAINYQAENPSWSAHKIELYLIHELKRTYNDFIPHKSENKYDEFMVILKKATEEFYK